jgi:hypothetical protein
MKLVTSKDNINEDECKIINLFMRIGGLQFLFSVASFAVDVPALACLVVRTFVDRTLVVT